MNNTFDWNRFCLVLKKDLCNLWPTFGTTMIVLASLPFTIWLLALVINPSFTIGPDWRVIMTMTVATFAALMLPSRLYRTMNLRNEGIYYAMLPASKLEKFISMLIFSFIVAPVLVYLGSMVIDIILYLLPAGGYRQWLWQGALGFPVINMANAAMSVDSPSGWITAVSWTSYTLNTALFLFTATLFKKHKVLFTFLAIYAIEFVGSVLLIPIMVSLSQNVEFQQWLSNVLSTWTPQHTTNCIFGTTTLLNCVLTLLFIWLAWQRLKKMHY